MRIIAGTSGGISIKVPQDSTRPTTDRVREAVFSSLGDSVINANVLDLFAGSGSLGIESLSRGALRALFVDQSKRASDVIRANLTTTSLAEKGIVRTSRVERYLDGLVAATKYDLVFADPPYARDEEKSEVLREFLNHEKLPAALTKEGLLILETFAKANLPETNLWTVAREKSYGDSKITYLHPSPELPLTRCLVT